MKISKELFIFSFFAIVFFSSRLANLTSLPVFADEAIYIRWAQIMKAVETLRFLPLTDGKQPLFMWSIIPFLKFISDPLLAGRFVSVFSGFLSFTALWFLCGLVNLSEKKPENPIDLLQVTFSKNLILKSILSLLFLANTYTFFFDRLATADNLLLAFLLLSLDLVLLQTVYLRLDLSLLIGGFLGLAWLTKSPAIIFLFLTTIYQLVFAKNKIKSFSLSLISACLMFTIYNLLRLGPQYHMIALRNLDYVWPLSEVIKHPLDPLKPHFFSYLHLLFQYLGPIIILIPIGLLLNNFKNKIFFLLFFLLPTLAVLSTTKVFTARYLLFTLPFLLIFLANTIDNIFKKNRSISIGLLLIAVLPCLLSTTKILLDPYKYKFPTSESGYNLDWTSGWGIKEVAKYAKQQAEKGNNVILAAEGNFGNPKDGLQMYLNNQKNVTVIPQEPLLYQVSPDLEKAKLAGDLVLIVHNSQRFHITDPIQLSHLKSIASYPKPDGSQLLLFQLK